MKKRLLFWTNVFMLHFGLAYYLQQKIDAEFYAIIDVPNKPKKMFQNQNLIDFQKTWYFHDQIIKTQQKPDLEYLSKFEEKYKIDLWKLVINERFFYRFNRFYKFSKDEILQILEQECKLFEQILDETKPDYFLIYDPPFHYQKLLLEICKVRNIKVLCIYFARIGGKSVIAEDGGTLDLPKEIEFSKLENGSEKSNDIKNEGDYSALAKKYKNDRGSSSSDKIKAFFDYILYSDSQNTKSNFTYYGRSKPKVILDTISLSIKRKNRARFMIKNLESSPDLNIPYVYFPMNVEEELSVLHYSPLFTNQIEIIRHLAKSIPIDHKLYVKEHPFAGFRGWHKIKEYQEIMEIPNVELIHTSVPSEDLIKQSKLVVTVRGTASFDAAKENIPSLVFGDIPFSILPSVYKVDTLIDIPHVIKTALKTTVNSEDVQKYIDMINEKSINFDMMDFEVKRNRHFYSGNILSDVDISENSVKEFFDHNKKYFQPLVDAHLSKINPN